ncbi:MAG: dipeptidase [Zestosphaera sp.]
MTYPVIDLHEDVSTYFLTFGSGQVLADFGADVSGRDADIPKYVRGNVRVVFASAFPGTHTFDVRLREEVGSGRWLPKTIMRYPQIQLFEHFKIYYALAEAYGIALVESAKDVDNITLSREYRFGFLIHVEGADSVDDPYDLILLRKLGLRSLGLTWNYNNKWASSCTSQKDYGLTPDGEELVKMANKLGIMLDVAHASRRTALEVLEASRKPVLISHANAKAVHNHRRNVEDEVLEALRRNGGVIGLTFVPSFISRKERPTTEDLVKHFIHVRETFGPDILAIGTDFHGLLGQPGPVGLETVDKVQDLLNLLRDRGFSETDLRKIAYENVLRVIHGNLQ